MLAISRALRIHLIWACLWFGPTLIFAKDLLATNSISSTSSLQTAHTDSDAKSDGLNQFVTKHWSTRDGLGVSGINDLHIDSRGFLWLGSNDGLLRFDGHEFRRFDVSNTPQMGVNRILQFGQTGSAVWFASTGNAKLLRIEGDAISLAKNDRGQTLPPIFRIQAQSNCALGQAGFWCADDRGVFQQKLQVEPGVRIHAAALDSKGLVYSLIDRHGLFVNRALSDQALLMPTPNLGHVKAFDIDQNDQLWLLSGSDLWIGDAQTGMQKAQMPSAPSDMVLQQIWFGADSKRTPIKPNREATSSSTIVNAMYRTQVLAAGSHGVYDFQNQVLRFAPLEPHVVSEDPLWSLKRDRHGRVWRGINQQLFCDEALVLTTNSAISDLEFDVDGNVWVSTYRDRIYRLSPVRVQQLPLGSRAYDGNFYGVSRANDGRIWLGSIGAGVMAVHEQNFLTQSFGASQGLASDRTWMVSALANDQLFAASPRPALLQLRQDRFETTENLNPNFADVRTVIQLNDGRLAVGGERGLIVQNAASNASANKNPNANALNPDATNTGWQQLWPSHQAAPNQVAQVQVIKQMIDGSVWIGTRGAGLFRLNLGSGESTHIKAIGDAAVRDLLVTQSGEVWVATESRGMYVFSPDKPDQVRALSRKNGLPSDTLHVFVAHNNGDVWINSNHGIFRLRVNEVNDYLAQKIDVLPVLQALASDGVKEFEGNGGVQPAAAVDGLGRIWFPSQRGINIVEPRAFHAEVAHAIVLQQLISGKTRLSLNDEAILPERNLSIEFTSPALSGDENLRFRHRLLPLQQEFNDFDGKREFNIAQLQPGQYRFEVQSLNGRGVLSPVMQLVQFSVPFRWFETWWFKAAVICALFGLVWLLFAARERINKRNAAELESQIKRRTQELAQQQVILKNALQELEQSNVQLETKASELQTANVAIVDNNVLLAEQADRLQQLDRFRRRLLADVSHELRTPLSLVLMPLQDLAANQQIQGKAKERVSLAITHAKRLTTLLEQLLHLVQAEAGRLQLRVSQQDLAQFLSDLVQAYSPAAQRVDVQLQLALETESASANFDPQLLTSAVGNLIDNAIKYAPKDSIIQVRLNEETNREAFYICVEDQGPGFRADANQLFQRFFREPQAPSQGREGLGIGLALAREVVHLHGGEIGAENRKHDDKIIGAHFWIRLHSGNAHLSLADLDLTEDGGGKSRIQSVASSKSIIEQNLRRTGDKHILLVEDHPALRRYLSDRLREVVSVTALGSAESALEALSLHRFDAMVSDVILPGISGIELATQCKAHIPDMPVVLISARDANDHQTPDWSRIADAYLMKPFGIEQLLDTLKQHLPMSLESGSIDDPLLRLAIERLSQVEFDYEQWVALAHLSDRQLRRRVTEVTGLAPTAWLREQRLSLARKLIETGQARNLAEAGLSAGFDNLNYFYRLYRARFQTE